MTIAWRDCISVIGQMVPVVSVTLLIRTSALHRRVFEKSSAARGRMQTPLAWTISLS